MNDLIFSLDPGSICTGWALMRPPEQLIKAGSLLPDRKKNPSEVRIGEMCNSLWQVLNISLPGTILIEWTSGKVGKKRHCGGGAGLGVHGAATGALWREVLAWLQWQPPEKQLVTKVHLIRENDWTRGVSKPDRAAVVAATFPEYKPEQDPGGDIADAIALSIWYLRERKVRLVEEAERQVVSMNREVVTI